MTSSPLSCSAEKGATPTLAVTALAGRTEPVGDLPGDDRGLVERLARQDHRELVAAQTGEHIGLPQAGAQLVGDPDEQLVAGVVAQGVVDRLEAVEVEDQQRAGGAVAAALGDLGLHRGRESAAVQQAGERVVVDEVAHAALGEALLGHVHGVDEHRGVTLAGAVDQRHVHRDAQAAPVGGQQVRVAAEGRLVAPDERRDERAAGGRLVGRHDPGGGQPGHLLAGAAEHRRERVVDAHVAAVAVQQRHADRRVVERVGEALLALRRLALRAAGLAGEPGERDGHEGAEQAADDEGDHAPAQMRRRGRRGAQVPLLPGDGDGPAVGVPGEPAVPADAGRALAQLERGAVREHAGHRADELGEAERADRRASERAVGGPHRRVDEDARDVGADEAADGGGLRRVRARPRRAAPCGAPGRRRRRRRAGSAWAWAWPARRTGRRRSSRARRRGPRGRRAPAA